MNKKTLILALLFLVILSTTLTAQNLLNEPEGVVFDSVNNRYLVSNWRDAGSIIQIDDQGNQTYFFQGLGNCANMYILDTILYVCVTNNTLVGLSLDDPEPEIVSYLPIATSGLHDIAYDYDGYFYATDWSGGRILKIDIAAQTYSVFIDHDLTSPCGILMDTAKNRLLVCSFGGNPYVQEVDIATGTVSNIVNTGWGNLDDIVMDKDRNFYVSSWTGSVTSAHRFDSTFSLPPDLINTGYGILIDLCYNERDKVIAISNSQQDSFELYELDPDEDDVLLWTDNCPENYNPLNEDTDSDGIGDSCDNCIEVYNPGQEDINENDIGDACEGCCVGLRGNADCSETVSYTHLRAHET